MSFLQNLPKGPLDRYRKLCTFDWKLMAVCFEGEEVLKFKFDVWNRMQKDPLFQRVHGYQTIEEQRRLTYLRMKRFKEWNILPWDEVLSSLRKILALSLACASYSPSFYTKYTLAYNFVQNTLLGLGAGKHQALSEELSNPHTELVGSFSLTEIAHGTNTKAMRTTATFIPESQEFEINTPDFEAAKCWVGNLGKTATHTVVFAQLVTPDGKSHGLHGFIVQVRDTTSLDPFPGITIGDLGEKIELNGMDNGFIMFQKFRIPKENILSKTGYVTPEGKYITAFKDPKKKLGASLGALSAGRVGLVSLATQYLLEAVVIATRYSAARKQFGPDEREEIPIIEYPLLQWRLFPYIATSYALKHFSISFFDVLMENMIKGVVGDKQGQAAEGPELHALSSAVKPLSGWLARDGIQECREICAGHGYLAVSRFGSLRGCNDGNLTYEGDNNVLIQQTSNWLLQLWSQRDKPGTWETPFKSVSFLSNWRQISQDKLTATSPSEVVHPENLLKMYDWLVLYLLQTTYSKLENISKKEKNEFNIKNNIQVYHAKPLSLVYGEHAVFKKFLEFSLSQEDKNIKNALLKLVSLFGAWNLEKHSNILYEGGYISNVVGSNLKQGVIDLCSSLKNEAVSLVDAVAPPDFILNSPLGCADGNIYKNLQAYLYQSPETFAKPGWLQDYVLTKNKL